MVKTGLKGTLGIQALDIGHYPDPGIPEAVIARVLDY